MDHLHSGCIFLTELTTEHVKMLGKFETLIRFVAP